MKTPDPIERLTSGGAFSFRKLDITGIDNDPVFRVNDPKMVREEICLFHRDVPSGNDYVKRIGDRVAGAMNRREPLPVVRFADGEYAFYHFDLACNGLYKQAESRASIRDSLPLHAEALRERARTGLLAPLVFPGNIEETAAGWKALFKRRRPSATTFLRYLHETGIPLTGDKLCPLLCRLRLFLLDGLRPPDGRPPAGHPQLRQRRRRLRPLVRRPREPGADRAGRYPEQLRRHPVE